jgi:hypothetical protein
MVRMRPRQLTPATGLRQAFTSNALIQLGTREAMATTPVGLGKSRPSFPRVAEYSNPGLEDGSPSGKMPKLQCILECP